MRPVVVGSSPKKGMDGWGRASNLDGLLWASPMNITYVPLDHPWARYVSIGGFFEVSFGP
jgi:hypothetical protein